MSRNIIRIGMVAGLFALALVLTPTLVACQASGQPGMSAHCDGKGCADKCPGGDKCVCGDKAACGGKCAPAKDGKCCAKDGQGAKCGQSDKCPKADKCPAAKGQSTGEKAPASKAQTGDKAPAGKTDAK